MQNRIKEIVARSIDRGKSKKSAILALTDQGIISVCNFLTIFVLARALPEKIFGLFILVHTSLLLLTSLQHASLTQAHNVLAARLEGSAYRDFNSSVIVLQLSFSLIGVCLLFSLAFVFQQFRMDEFAAGCSGLGIVLAPWLIRDLVRRVLYTQQRIGANLLNDTVSYGLQIVGIIALMQYPAGQDIRSIFLILGASSAIAVGFGIIQLRATISFGEITMESFKLRLREIWRFGRWLSGSELLGWMGQYGHTWLIAAILGVGPLGGYRAALLLSNILNPIELACSTYLPPKASRVYASEGHNSLTRWLRSRAFVMGSLYLSIVIAIILFARPLLDLVYNGKYSSTEFVLVLALGVVGRAIGFVSTFFRIALTVIEKTYALFVENLIALVFVGSVSLVVIQSLGIVGAPIAKIILSSLLAVYGYLMVSCSRPASNSVVLTHADGDSK